MTPVDPKTTRWSLRGFAPAAWFALLGLFVAGCSIDFNEAVPCDDTAQCPSDYVCNLDIGRCELGRAPIDDTVGDTTPDTGADAPDDVASDSTPGDVSPDPDVGTGDPDIAEVDDSAGEPDVASDACIEMPEECNGEDDNCNGIPDDGLDCGTCPDADNMALILRDGEDAFCVDLYEASRPDASLASPGSDESMSASQRAVIPWAEAPFATAETACTAAGKRLCSATEWIEACGGPQGWLYPYNATTYDPNTCNGSDTPDPDSVGPTASRINCVSPDGAFDMSGNLEEWVVGSSTRGGAYDDDSLTLRCTGDGESPNPAAPGGTVGFRCCADAVTPE